MRLAKKLSSRFRKLYRNVFINIPVFLAVLFLNNLTKNKKVRLRCLGNIENRKNILLIRHDAIGDYILFRNFIKVLRDSKKYGDYKITLVGNDAWREIAERLDGGHVGEFIWLDKAAFKSSASYRYKKLKEIASKDYETVIHPFSNNFFNADNDITILTWARKKIGRAINPERARTLKLRLINFLLGFIYKELIYDEAKPIFEFYSNQRFFGELLGEKAGIRRPLIGLNPAISAENIILEKNLKDSRGNDASALIAGDYALLFIGASVKHRKWPVENFAEAGRYLTERYGFGIVLCGGESEEEEAAKFAERWEAAGGSENRAVYVDLVGKISLYELLYVVKGAKIVVSNESMLPHIAVAVDGPAVFVISGGEDCYGHFVPYPEDITKKYFVVFHPTIEKDMESYKKRSDYYGYGHGYDMSLDLSEITTKDVTDRLDSYLKNG